VNENEKDYDAVVVGAGFAGLYALYRLRESGLRVRVYERGSGVGGTWFWNRYPGARCDIESVYYSYQFSDELQKEWRWSARYAPQAEILAYLDFVADKFDLRKDIRLSTSVDSMVWDEERLVWVFTLETGETVTSRFAVMGTGLLNDPVYPDIEGVHDFGGLTIHTSRWPSDGADVSGKRVGIIGTGSSSIQATPIIAEQAGHLHIFQRTPQYTIPAWNRPHTDEEWEQIKNEYDGLRARAWETFGGVSLEQPEHGILEATPDEREEWLEYAWSRGGYAMIAAYPDTTTNMEVNAAVADFVRRKTLERIPKPELVDQLMPQYPFAAKRLCVDTNYYETYAGDNVSLVDLRANPIERVEAGGVRLADGTLVELDVLIYATGYDAVTGPLLRLNPIGRGGVSIRDKWEDGARSFLGIMVESMPNMFTINGPLSPSLIYNIPAAIEHHLGWIDSTIAWLDEHDYWALEPTLKAETEWTEHVAEVADTTIYPKVDSWYMGCNVPGKPRVFLAYCGGGPAYFERVNAVAENDYRDCILTVKEAVGDAG
jgi:cation diffusion facilitator CzcD-associated flavoprotein CzcO